MGDERHELGVPAQVLPLERRGLADAHAIARVEAQDLQAVRQCLLWQRHHGVLLRQVLGLVRPLGAHEHVLPAVGGVMEVAAGRVYALTERGVVRGVALVADGAAVAREATARTGGELAGGASRRLLVAGVAEPLGFGRGARRRRRGSGGTMLWVGALRWGARNVRWLR
ncbi:hypothetical protein FGB62_159g113 [Gracilaria domingensis]|nr:hypothetical protein FGB62_159g113 [Gracilaria domingensis]